MLFTQNVTNITFIFETSSNTKPREKSGGDIAYYVATVWKSGGTRPPCPHQIAPMFALISGQPAWFASRLWWETLFLKNLNPTTGRSHTFFIENNLEDA